MKRKSQGKTCIICGQRKSNESFSGGGHAKNICKKCARLSKGERDERVLINRIENIGLRMDRKKWKWLEELRNDPRENVRRAAEEVYQHESARYREFKEALRKDEEALEAYQLPLELKYLPIIESALNPKAVSRVGATGLWQFMLTTGKQYGLQV
ncbi:MAG: transglycosylase SLT domain-containing protein, partial [Blautia sp.]|nr:transglycosylase SLT domain-containing protein [Blautia sp.]